MVPRGQKDEFLKVPFVLPQTLVELVRPRVADSEVFCQPLALNQFSSWLVV